MTQVKAVRIHETGGPEVMTLESIALPDPGPGEARVRLGAVGLNFIDTYQRSGLYPVPLPTGLGLEGAGTVEALGDAVSSLTIGDRVAFGTGPMGAYAEAINVPETRVVKLPDTISDEVGAAMMLQGMTAQYLLRQTFFVREGDTILVHAAAGGVGLIMCQWAKHLGATVIGTVGSEEKAELARAHGCDHPILYRNEDVAKRVKEITGGQGVPVVYDSVGKDTLMASLDSLSPLGLFVTFGNASGPTGPIDPLLLSAKGSLFMTRPTLFHYTATPEALAQTAGDLIDVVSSGAVKINVHQRYKLDEIVKAHQDMEGRKTTGASVVLP